MIALMRRTGFAMAVLTLLFAGGSATAQELNVTPTGLALRGYDPVSYFTGGKPVLGRADISAEHKGAVYRFATDANKQAFVANPDKYAPQFGGYCAFAAALGKKFDGDPNVWKIVDGKLYLNLSPAVAKRWNEDIPGNIRKANQNWSQIKDKMPKELQ